jgi:hypothetical protein
MSARRWNEAGQTVEQFQRRQRQLPTAVEAWLVEAVDQALPIVSLGQPCRSPARPGAVAQQAFQRRAVMRSDADRGIDREAAAVLSPGHVLGG